MALSRSDWEFMSKVSEYFRGTKTDDLPEGSLRDTANYFGLARTKIRKILVTTGDFVSDVTAQALQLKDQGLSNKEIAVQMKMSEATISTYLPYDGLFYRSPDVSDHAKDVRRYRAYERDQQKRQKKLQEQLGGERKMKKEEYKDMSPNYDNKSWKDDYAKEIRLSYQETLYRSKRVNWDEAEANRDALLQTHPAYKNLEDEFFGYDKPETEQYPGAMRSRNVRELEEVSGEKLPYEPRDVLRIHLELVDKWGIDETDIEELRRHGHLQYGNNISRDLIIPQNLPLYALHYVIQRAFGWQNSHLHEFLLPKDRSAALSNGNVAMWSCMVGILFRSPIMDERDAFWADDYNGGSFRGWMRKKYTGPYRSLCQGEHLFPCLQDMMSLEKKGYLESTSFEKLQWDYQVDPFTLLERLTVAEVLAAGDKRLLCDEDEEIKEQVESGIVHSGTELYKKVEGFVKEIIEAGIDSPDIQVPIQPVTDKLIYRYDFGDDWHVEITASENCADLVETGRTSQKELDRAQIKCRKLYRPVMIARDGDFVMDDVGGISGYVNFLHVINSELDEIEDPDERRTAKRECKEYLEWAKGLGWSRKNDNARNINWM